MGTGAYLEPLVVVGLLFGGAWINRAREVWFTRKSQWQGSNPAEGLNAAMEKHHPLNTLDTISEFALSPPLLASQYRWRTREISVLGYKRQFTSPNTTVFRGRFLSRVLHKFPFLVECWYWALIYWVS